MERRIVSCAEAGRAAGLQHAWRQLREHLEAPHETAIYDAGGLVVRARYQEGKKWFLAFQPPSWVRENLLVSFREVRAVAVPAEARLAQDVWSARKPA
ncbi:MAG: hypothetical protein WDN04_04065 [Rhodospirillales bacterium]